MTDFSHASVISRSGGVVLTADPTVNHDNSVGWAAGDMVFVNTTNTPWICLSNATGAAKWMPVNRGGTGQLIACLLSANMNVTTDQPFVMMVPSTLPFRVTKVSSTNALLTTSISVAHGGIYTAASKGGTAIVADGATNFAGQTTTAAIIDLTVVSGQLALVQAAGTVLILSLTAGQGAACTSDLRVYGDLIV